eukprot:c10264_g1_i1.p1 GENE.c10264_g1_i1~~c10264_g1_i1.p1  ORF type:complete len:308 (-),score=43.50 c10264_g1_i1:89-1012(-)
MGQLLALIKGDLDRDLIIDFENAQPHDAFRHIYDMCEDALRKSALILDKLKNYGPGCNAEIRVALSEPSPENDRKVWLAITPKVTTLKEIHTFSQELGSVFPKLLGTICTDDPIQSLQDQQALAKQLASIFDFVLKFDELKMHCPQLQNDFAFYRRNVGRVPQGITLPISDEDCAMLSMYFAAPAPMMSTLTQACTTNQNSIPGVNTLLAAVAGICQSMVHRKSYSQPQTQLLCLRCMVASIVLFDFIDSKGAFHRKSPINIKKCVSTLRTCHEQSTAESLFNTLKFSTKHLNDADTPTSVSELFRV